MMKVICLLAVLLAVAFSADLDCSNTAVSTRITALLTTQCSAEIQAILSVSSPDELFTVDCSVQCTASVRALYQYSICGNIAAAATWNPILAGAGAGVTVTDEDVASVLIGLSTTCRISNPDPAPGARCRIRDVMTLRNAADNVTTACGPVDEASPASVCTGECKRAREDVSDALARCRHREGLIDHLVSPIFQTRLRGIDRACDAAEFVHDTATKCRSVPFADIYAGLRAECGIPEEGDSVSVACRVAVRASIQLFNKCINLIRATTDVGFFTEEVRNNLRRWRRAARIRTRRIEAALSAGAELVSTSTDDLREMRSTAITRLGLDANGRLTFDYGRKADVDDSTFAERFRISFDRLCEVSYTSAEFDGDASLAFDASADSDRIVECHRFSFTARDCSALDLGTAYTAETGTIDRSEIDAVRVRNPARLFRHSCRFGPSRLARVLINSAIVSEESATFGLRARAGGSTAPWIFSDIPRRSRDDANHIAVCVFIDTENDVNETAIAPVDVDDSADPLDDSVAESDIAAAERGSAEVRLGSRRFRFRKWAYCNSDQKLRVRHKCVPVPAANATDTELDTPKRFRCCFVFVRSGSDPICDRIYFDPSGSATQEDDEAIPLPPDTNPGTDGTDATPTPTPTPTPSVTPTPSGTPTPSSTSSMVAGLVLVILALAF